MGSRIARCCSMFMTVAALCLSMGMTVSAVDTAVDVQATDATQGAAVVDFPESWTIGENQFNVTSDEVCVASVTREDGSSERLYAAVLNEETGDYRFKVNIQNGDHVVVALKGDADLDGVIDFVDATTVNQYMLHLRPLSPEAMYAADADSDGTVDFVDATTINQYMLGLYSFKWDIGWTVDDSPLTPEDDPDLDATLVLSADAYAVSAGEPVTFTLTSDIENDYTVEWSVEKGGKADDIGLRNLDEDGGTVVFNEGSGSYTFSAVATTSTGVVVTSNEVTIQVDNQAPVITSVKLTPDYSDTTTGYEEATAIKLMTEVEAYDPNGDEFQLKFEIVNGDTDHSILAVGESYRDPGTYTIRVYAVDTWGASSEVWEQSIDIYEQDEVPFIITPDLTVHIGEPFEVAVNEEVLEDAFTTWTLTRNSDGAEVAFDQSNMTKYGGTMAVTDGTGVYTLHAVGTDEYGVDFDMDTLVITVVNGEPYTDGVTHTVIYDDFQDPFTEDAKVKVDFEFDGQNDPDKDDTVVWVQNPDGEDYPLEDGYYDRGEHTLTLYTVDEWGMKSDPFEYTFTVENVAPDKPQFSFDVQYDNWKYDETTGQQLVWVEVTITTSDGDGNPTRPNVTGTGVESGWYPAGHYTVEGVTEDAWLTPTSGTNAGSFDVLFEESYITVNGITNETWVHQGDEFTVESHYGDLHVSRVQWQVTGPDGESVTFGEPRSGYYTSTGWSDSGAKLTIEAKTGDFVITATATLNDNTRPEAIVDTYVVHIYNEPPVTPEITVNVDYTNVTSVDGELRPYVTIGVTSSDPEGDDFDIEPYDYSDGAIYVYESGYMAEGTYTTAFIATDEFGASSTNRYDFEVRFPNMPTIYPDALTEHIGDLFNIQVNTQGMVVDHVEYTLLDAEEEPVEWVGTLDETGGNISINTVDGEYVLTAVMVFPDGTRYTIGSVDITITNEAPVANLQSYELLEYRADDDSLLTEFVIPSSDPDGDEYTIYYAIDDPKTYAILASDTIQEWCTNGSHVMYLYGVDEWGKTSEVFQFPFVTAPYLDPDTLPVVDYTVTDNFFSQYQANAERYVDFDVTWTLDGEEITLDNEHVTIYYKVDGQEVASLTDLHFSDNERHYVEVWAEDVLGAVCQVGKTDFYLTNNQPLVNLIINDFGYDPRVEEVISDEKGTDDEDLPLQIIRRANGQTVDDFNALEPGHTYELELIVTDSWGTTVTKTGTLVISSDAPVVNIVSHKITQHDTDNVLSYVEFDWTFTAHNEDEYVFQYWVDGKPADGLDGWFALGDHEVAVRAESKLEPGKVSNRDVYPFTVSDEAPNPPVLTHEINREDIINQFSEEAAVKVTFDWTLSDPDSDVANLVSVWIVDGKEVDDPNGYYPLGTHTVYAYSVDEFGVKSELGSTTFAITNEAPVVKRAWYTVNSHTADGLDITVHWTVTDPDGDETLDYSTLNSDPFVTGIVSTDGKVFILIEAMDEFGQWSHKYELLVNEENNPPTTPVIDYDILGDISNAFQEGATVGVKVSATSTDPDGDAVTIYWSFGEQTAPGQETQTSVGAGHTVISAWAVDSFGNRSGTASIQIDNINEKPSVTGTWTPNWDNSQNAFTTDASVWVDITANVTDDNTDDCVLYWSVDNGEFTTTNPSGYYGLGRHMIQVYAVDKWGAKSNTDLFYVEFSSEKPDAPTIDMQALRANIQGTPYTTDAKHELNLTFTAVDPDDDPIRVMYSLDGEPYVEADNGVLLHRFISIGSHPITAYAVDFWGLESDRSSKTQLSENSAPAIYNTGLSDFTEADIVDPYTSNAHVELNISADVADRQNDAYRLEVTVDGKPYEPGDSVSLYPGSHDIVMVARDIFGAVSNELRFTQDIGGSAPVIQSASASGNDTYRNAYTKSATEYVVLDYQVVDPDGDSFIVYADSEQLQGGNGKVVLGDYALGQHTAYVVAKDIWGMSSAVYPVTFTLSNGAPLEPTFEAAIDLSKVNNPYTRRAEVWTDTTLKTSDPDNDTLRNYFSVNGSEYVYEGDGVFDDDFYKAGTYEIKVYSLDPWGEQSPTTTYTLVIGGGVDASIIKPSVLGSGQSTSGYTVPFTVRVDSDNPFQLSWLDFYDDNKTVTEVGEGYSEGVIDLRNPVWTGNNHLLVVQAVSILGEVDYDTMFFMTGVSDTSGSAGVTGTGVTVTTPALMDDGLVLGYVESFSVSVPAIDGHSSGNSDYLKVTGIDENGNRTELVTAPSTHAYVSITGTSGNGSYQSDGEPASGTFTYETGKYVSLEFTFYSPHESCMNSGGASMTYSVSYGFGNNDEILDNLDDLFGNL